MFLGSYPEGWLFRAEEYFTFHDVAEEPKIHFTSLNMQKSALAWLRGLKKNNLISTWEKFGEDVLERGPSKFDDHLLESSRYLINY